MAIRCICALLCLTVAIALPSLAAAQQSKDTETARIELIIRNYLLANPELLVEVMQKFGTRCPQRDPGLNTPLGRAHPAPRWPPLRRRQGGGSCSRS